MEKSETEIINMIQAKIKELGTQRAVAEWIGIFPSALNSMLKRRRTIPDKVARKFGYRLKEPTYVKDEEKR